MKKQIEEFGLFIYLSDPDPAGCDECIYMEYFKDKKKAIKAAKERAKGIDKDEYIEVWRKENNLWGASGEPIYKSDL